MSKLTELDLYWGILCRRQASFCEKAPEREFAAREVLFNRKPVELLTAIHFHTSRVK
jgi:hypothetical protein